MLYQVTQSSLKSYPWFSPKAHKFLAKKRMSRLTIDLKPSSSDPISLAFGQVGHIHVRLAIPSTFIPCQICVLHEMLFRLQDITICMKQHGHIAIGRFNSVAHKAINQAHHGMIGNKPIHADDGWGSTWMFLT